MPEFRPCQIGLINTSPNRRDNPPKGYHHSPYRWLPDAPRTNHRSHHTILHQTKHHSATIPRCRLHIPYILVRLDNLNLKAPPPKHQAIPYHGKEISKESIIVLTLWNSDIRQIDHLPSWPQYISPSPPSPARLWRHRYLESIERLLSPRTQVLETLLNTWKHTGPLWSWRDMAQKSCVGLSP